MGYYSDVAIVLNNNAKKMVDEQAKENEELRTLLDVATITKEKDGCRMYVWNDIKWYNNNGIDELEDCLDNIKECEFIYHIIGEDLEDVSTQGFFWHNPFECKIVRRIEFTE